MPMSAEALPGDISIRPKGDHGRSVAADRHLATAGRRPLRGTPVAGGDLATSLVEVTGYGKNHAHR